MKITNFNTLPLKERQDIVAKTLAHGAKWFTKTRKRKNMGRVTKYVWEQYKLGKVRITQREITKFVRLPV